MRHGFTVPFLVYELLTIKEDIANYFNVSLRAAAFRYVNIGKYPTAVICSKDGIVKWSACHDYFLFKFIRIGTKVHKNTSAYDFFTGNTIQTCEDLVPAKFWFPEEYSIETDIYLNEQNVSLPNYNTVLTLLGEENRYGKKKY